ncbi:MULTISPECIES: ABC transporter ATP-binding protein [Rhodococcus]|uniref:ABC transporter ATP-binding protein n=1 Tax=Rhodococcus TaxID=1827 RepID=UPI001E5F6FF0|nr:ABC transporter ATP-binding protein [Rhodococcus pyridinivorans]MCD2118261.1 ABC transporter ATP-binding protein [Rhodococcus pyridinivorans]MCZ4627132.1 ABC transporter ATP-binding protein [Rhodococcus pyridinivorans]MCZ4648330.1 ABC transporter ATP-binding protein [Rhodococcus pyridinivorans]MDJ0481050.1 ABC transporter ATP-binding protein [Rhodococcus pyridinivorans]MDV7254489.1 ABC transporter ATP-binding protein [Rhodococcus pyridinivorans]
MRVTVDQLGARRGDRDILRDISFEVPSGTVLGLLGPNGSGKSTLLRALSGIDIPSAGTVRYDNALLAALTRRQLAQRVAVMTQEHSEEFEIPVLDLVLLGRIPHGAGFGRDSDSDIALALGALAQVGAGHLASRAFSELSGGERQRVLFARALTQDTPVLILDEPTNHLDIAHQLELLDLVRTTERTVLVALHDLNLAARNCDAIGVLADGGLIAYGAPDEVLDVDLIRSVFHVESTSVVHPRTGQRHFVFDERVRTADEAGITLRKEIPIR